MHFVSLNVSYEIFCVVFGEVVSCKGPVVLCKQKQLKRKYLISPLHAVMVKNTYHKGYLNTKELF